MSLFVQTLFASSVNIATKSVIVYCGLCRSAAFLLKLPCPKTSKYGGNTSCVELNCDGKIIIPDSGTGIRELGHDIISRNSVEKDGMYNLYVFFSHVHWDHIQGFPFFRPAFYPEFEINLYGAKHSDVDIECALRGQMVAPYSPIRLSDMPARINFKGIKSGEVIQIGKIVIKVFH